jgi:adenylate kinase
MNLIFLGPPGSGKGTQAKRLSDQFGLIHVSTGDLFRDAIKDQTELGREIQAFVDSGKLVPDDLVSDVVFDKLKTVSEKLGFLLDGYPRTIDQAKSLDAFVARQGRQLDGVIFFDVALSQLADRFAARRTCGQCKTVYSLVNRPPKTANICDVCGGELIQRPDDRIEIVNGRLSVYARQTEPILSYYQSRSQYRKVDAGRGIDQVYEDIVNSLGLQN